MEGDDSIRCRYCLEELKYLEEPKLLPCGHVFCKECMSVHIQPDRSYQCFTCRRVYENVDVGSLPPAVQEANVTVEKVVEIKETPRVFCDKCKDDQPAVRYCQDCNTKCCARHMEFHDGYFEGAHTTVEIAKYMEKMNSYNSRLTCETHRKEAITMACKRCYTYNCLTCDENSPLHLCNGSSEDHIYLPLKKIEKEIRDHFEKLLKRTSERIEEVAMIEKNLWVRLDRVEEECATMTSDAERKTEEQINLIRQQSETLISQIQDYKQEKTTKVITFLEELMTKKDNIDAVRVSAHKFLGDIHIRELIRSKQQKTDEITRANNTALGTCDWQDKKLRIGVKRRMEIEFWVPKAINNIQRGYGPPDFFATNPGWNV